MVSENNTVPNSNQGQDFSKLTVPQLKALCKERKIKGYSKLGRGALLQVLCEVTGVPPVFSATPGTSSDVLSNRPNTIVEPVKSKKAGSKTQKVTQASSKPLSLSQASGLDCGGQAQHPSISQDDQSTSGSDEGRAHSPSASAGILAPLLNSPHTPVFSLPQNERRGLMLPPPTIPAGCSVPPPPAIVAPVPGPRVGAPVIPAKRQSNTPDLQPHKRFQVLRSSSSSSTTSVSGVLSVVTPHLLQKQSQPSTETSTNGGISASRIVPNTLKQVDHPQSSAGKRFKPLVLSKPIASGASGDHSTANPGPTRSKAQNVFARPTPSQPLKHPIQLRYLDISFATVVPSLDAISLPPPLTQRKRVQFWAIILAGLSDAEREQCVLVSRTFRYAVYMSASYVLDHRFFGQRLRQVYQQYSRTMINFWPYLRVREVEATQTRKLAQSSCLWKLVKQSGANPISARLWGSPDHKKQIAIALRFVLTRYWFILSVGGCPKQMSAWLEETVVDAQEVIPNEIWSITVQKSKSTGLVGLHIFYALEATCEVVGCTSSSLASHTMVESGSRFLRADWSNYIWRCHAGMDLLGNQPTPSIYDHLKWDNHEEYDKGISKLWLKRLTSGEEDVSKLIVARRYVLACVVGNSVSGSWMSSSEMAQEFAGLSAKVNSSNVKNYTQAPLNLYLPAVHHVESVHFRTPKGELLHPALAVVQTPAREYFVLKDNGLEVGNEDNGVYGAWMEALDCNHKGVHVPP